MTKKIALYVLTIFITLSAAAQPIDPNKPRLVVNIIVSGMRSVDLERYQSNVGLGGLRLLYEEGLRYDNCQYSYQQTTTPVSLSTLATGAQPSTHGVVGESWFDYVTNEKVDLIFDSAAKNFEYPLPEGGYSALNLFVPTLSEALLIDSPRSQSVTVALDPVSSIMLAGNAGTPFWFDEYTCNWASSSAYMTQLPQWAMDYNHSDADVELTATKWSMSFHSDLYVNSRYQNNTGGYILGNAVKINRNENRRERLAKYYKQISSTPIGNDIVASFASLAVASMKLGGDEYVDILNVCFDASRNIVERYGPESIEAEDMYYKIDRTIAELIKFIDSQVKDGSVVYLLTSDHGTSPTVDVESSRFNSRQFEVILNGFLSVRYGSDNWVLACENGAVYLNHNAVYKKNLTLSEVQSEAATFALQLQGVSHAITSTTLSSSYFGNGYAQKIQSGFYPRRSGDVILNFMPNWIERDVDRVSQSGSMYNYDRAVPLVIYGRGVPAKVVSRSVDAVSVAPTLAAIMGISEPAASEGRPLEELTNRNE
ncbi:MAG: alkaline phosphatase family protein [Rikenellaceae bacterium]